MDKVTYKFPSGVEVTGTFGEIEKVAKALGEKIDYTLFPGKIPRGYYPSESKGIIKINEMAEFHIRRALLKRAKDYFTGLHTSVARDSVSVFLDKFTKLVEDPIINDLFVELTKKK